MALFVILLLAQAVPSLLAVKDEEHDGERITMQQHASETGTDQMNLQSKLPEELAVHKVGYGDAGEPIDPKTFGDDIEYPNRRILQYVRKCETDVLDECVARTCPKYCSSMVRMEDALECSKECTEEARCKKWQPGLPTFDTDATVEKQTFTQVTTCVGQKRLTSGYSGGDWKSVSSPSFRKALAFLVEKQVATRTNAENRQQKKLAEGNGILYAAEGVFAEIGNERAAVVTEASLAGAAHRAWRVRRLQLYPEEEGKIPEEMESVSPEQQLIYVTIAQQSLEVLQS